MKTQSHLIGEHPLPPDKFGVFLDFVEYPVSERKKHRGLTKKEDTRSLLIDSLSDWIIQHHISPQNIARLSSKAEIFSRYDFDEYLDDQHLLPLSDKTRKGNATEIFLAEYLKSSSRLTTSVFRLQYNPNVEQSMKGDDVLLFDLTQAVKKVIVGEAKFRSVPRRSDVRNIITNLQDEKAIPMSILFVSKCMEVLDPVLSDLLFELNSEIHKDVHDLRNVGLLLSDENTSRIVEINLDTTNSNLVFLSFGIEDPQSFIDESYRLAEDKLKAIKP